MLRFQILWALLLLLGSQSEASTPLTRTHSHRRVKKALPKPAATAVESSPVVEELPISAAQTVALLKPLCEALGEKPARKPTLLPREEAVAPTALATLAPSSAPHPMAFVLAATGLAALGAGGLLTYWGRKDDASLAQCSPWCAPATVEHVKTLYVAADIAIGAGVATLAASVLVFARGGSHDDGPMIDIRPTASGAVASVSGSY
jgi:hypothetical protein